MTRILVVFGTLLAVAGGVIVFMDGLSFRRELEYRDPDLALGQAISVNIQNVRQSGWGGSLLEGSAYGPPFDLVLFGTLPQGTAVRSVLLKNLQVTAPDGATLLSAPSATLPLADGDTLRAGVSTPNRTYSYEALAFTAATPSSITVSLELLFQTDAAPERVVVTKHYHLRRIRRISLGGHDWHF